MAEAYARPSIPEKKYFTIGEVSNLCQIKPHVLRYWEQEFPQLKPAKRRGNRRYYQREDIDLIKQICQLLYFQGYTINGARAILTKQSTTQSAETIAVETVVAEVAAQKQRSAAAGSSESSSGVKIVISDMLRDLEALLGKLTEA
ncbi:MAG: MerR family transcriptional regulator [Gammaproteobacteria bacterium]|nr:MerR family transcriptional regulator [Gammaproteobacteria bacterium]